jgi:hypothetical protein
MRLALILTYWQKEPVDSVAKILRMKTKEAQSLIEDSLKRLKAEPMLQFVNRKEFRNA